MAIVLCAGGCSKLIMTAQNNLGSPRDDAEWYCDECYEQERQRREREGIK